MIRTLPALALLAALGVSACTVGPAYRPPPAFLSGAYLAQVPIAGRTGADLDAWWQAFGDVELARIVERAAAQNLDFAEATARVDQARAAVTSARAALDPSLEAQASAADGSQSLLSPIGKIGSRLPAFERNYQDYSAGVVASWELDLFGGRRRALETAQAELIGKEAEAAAVRTSIQAEAADAYLQVRGFQSRIDVARSQVRVEEELLTLVSKRLEQGVAAEREQHQTQAALSAVQASIPPLTAGLSAQLNRLDVLMGAQPGTYRTEIVPNTAVPAPPALSRAVMPGDLMRRRPDIIAAEQRLIASNARIGMAISNYYPKISLGGLLGSDSLSAGGFLTGEAAVQQISAGFRWRLFDFGRVDAEVMAARGREREALAAYRNTALHAVQEVETCLSELQQQKLRSAALSRELEQRTYARHQSQLAYEGGVASLLEVRDADRDLLNASDQLVQSRVAASRAAVASFRALGGGWPSEARTTLALRRPPNTAGD